MTNIGQAWWHIHTKTEWRVLPEEIEAEVITLLREGYDDIHLRCAVATHRRWWIEVGERTVFPQCVQRGLALLRKGYVDLVLGADLSMAWNKEWDRAEIEQQLRDACAAEARTGEHMKVVSLPPGTGHYHHALRITLLTGATHDES